MKVEALFSRDFDTLGLWYPAEKPQERTQVSKLFASKYLSSIPVIFQKSRQIKHGKK